MILESRVNEGLSQVFHGSEKFKYQIGVRVCHFWLSLCPVVMPSVQDPFKFFFQRLIKSFLLFKEKNLNSTTTRLQGLDKNGEMWLVYKER